MYLLAVKIKQNQRHLVVKIFTGLPTFKQSTLIGKTFARLAILAQASLLNKICFINLQPQQLIMSFNLFGKKEDAAPESVFTDRTYMTGAAKMNACLALAKEQPQTLFICWFSDTLHNFKTAFLQAGLDNTRVMDARNVHSAMLQDKTPVFTEHYPLHSKELALIEHWPKQPIVVFSAMDEALFLHFGSEKMLPLMKLLGMKENEVIEHSFVTKSIVKGQGKIAAQVEMEQTANSQAEWMKKNIRH